MIDDQSFIDNIEKRRIEMNMSLDELERQAESMYYAYVNEWTKGQKFDPEKYSLWSDLKEVTKSFYRHIVVRDI